MSTAIGGLLRRAVDVREDEVAAVGWSFVYFFLVLASYFVLRPIRDQMGVAGGVDVKKLLGAGAGSEAGAGGAGAAKVGEIVVDEEASERDVGSE